jgi:hypothetical protein
MKITENKFKLKVKTKPIQFSILNKGQIEVISIKFKAIFEDDKPLSEILINGQLEVTEWFGSILRQKLIGTEPTELEQFRLNYPLGLLTVESTELPYISRTLFRILHRLEPRLKSLEYETNN